MNKLDNYKRKCFNKRLSFQEEGRKEIDRYTWDHSAGCMLFWAEGEKNKNCVKFTNCDLHTLRFFVEFLKKYYDVKNDKIRLTIHYHSNNPLSIEEIHEYWIKQLNIQGCQVKKPWCKPSPKDGKIKHLYGVVRIGVYDTRIVNRIWGSIQQYLKIYNPNYLEST